MGRIERQTSRDEGDSVVWAEVERSLGLRAVIFDMDGVLADTHPLHEESWAILYRRYRDGPLPRDLIRETFGQTNDRIIPRLLGPDVDVRRAGEFKEATFREIARGRVRPMPGLTRYLDAIRRRGLRTAIASSGPPENVALVVREFGWEDRFEAIVDRSAFARSKPEPDAFIEAAAGLGVEPARALVFEDSVHGLEAARRAGMARIALLGTAPIEVLRTMAIAAIRDFHSIAIDVQGTVPEETR